MAELQQSIGSTPLLGIFNREAADAFTPVLEGRQPEATVASTGAAGSQVLRRAEQSRTLNELQHHPVYGRLWQSPEERPAPSQVEAATDHRLMILARKYEGAALTREDAARVAILTQRLRRLAPRVNHLSWTIAEESVTSLEAASARIDEIGEKYGL